MHRYEWNIYRRLDLLRRIYGELLDQQGLGPIVSSSRTVFSERLFILRRYGAYDGKRPVVLIVPAPIKRSYIWDLLPNVSVVRHLLHEMQVYLIEWESPGAGDQFYGLAEYADLAISKCQAFIEKETGLKSVFLAGHSLGGTLAAIFSCLYPEKIRGLILLGAPLNFGPGAGDIDRLVAHAPPAGLVTYARDNVPGTFLDLVSFAASPGSFIFLRWADWVRSFAENEAIRIHIAVERWTLDETQLSRRLFEEVTEKLYRSNLFIRGKLKVRGKSALPKALYAPILSVVDSECSVVPPQSTLPFHNAVKSAHKKVLWYQGDVGIALRHVGPLVGRNAHKEIWPEILRWVKEHSP